MRKLPNLIVQASVLAVCAELLNQDPEPVATAVYSVAVTCIRPEELAFKWSDLDVEKRQLWIRRAVNRGKLHTPKYHRSNRPIQLTASDVQRIGCLRLLEILVFL